MTERTPFAGLIRIPAGSSLSENGFELQYADPLIVDRLLHVGAVSHRHDGLPGLSNPAEAPAVIAEPTGGSIPAGEVVRVAHSFVDADEGETEVGPTEETATTSGLTDPAKAPAAEVKYTAGSLLSGSYVYGVTIIDETGGESLLSPLANATVNPGHANAEIKVSLLAAILAETAGSEWRLWRSRDGSVWYLMAQGVGESVTDDGALAGDCTVEPPTSSTTSGTGKLAVIVPDPEDPSVVAFRLYASTTGTFGSRSLLGEYPASEFGETINFTTLALEAGQPPPVNRSYPHAAKIDPNTDILEWPYKQSVAKLSELPTEGNVNGDVRLVTETGNLYYWHAESETWRLLGGEQVKPTLAYTIEGSLPEGLLPGEFIYAPAPRVVKLKGFRAIIQAGTSARFSLMKNGVAIAGYKELTITKAKSEHFADVALADGDEIALLLEVLTGSPKALTFTGYLGYS